MHERFVMSKFGRILLCAFELFVILFPSSVILCAFFLFHFVLFMCFLICSFHVRSTAGSAVLVSEQTQITEFCIALVLQEKHHLVGKYGD